MPPTPTIIKISVARAYYILTSFLEVTQPSQSNYDFVKAEKSSAMLSESKFPTRSSIYNCSPLSVRCSTLLKLEGLLVANRTIEQLMLIDAP